MVQRLFLFFDNLPHPKMLTAQKKKKKKKYFQISPSLKHDLNEIVVLYWHFQKKSKIFLNLMVCKGFLTSFFHQMLTAEKKKKKKNYKRWLIAQKQCCISS